MFSFCSFYILEFKNFSRIFVSLCKELLQLTFLSFPIVLDDLYKVYGCSIIIDFISTMFEFLKHFDS